MITGRPQLFQRVSCTNTPYMLRAAYSTDVDKSIVDNLMNDMLERNASKKQERSNIISEIQQFSKSDPSTKRRIQTARIHWRNKFQPGDTYSPDDLVEQAYDQKRMLGVQTFDMSKKNKDELFEVTGISPSKEYKNAALLSEYVNDIGQVLPTRKTGLTRDRQKEMTKTLNKAVSFGVIPRSKKHAAMIYPREQL